VNGSGLRTVAQQRQAQVDGVLNRFFSLAKNRAAAFGPEYVELWESLEANTNGGKRFRPRMVFAAYEALGGKDLEAAAYVGSAFELLHTALIVHDDVIDHDFVRRGIPNISGAFRNRALRAGASKDVAEHNGVSAAVIAGDLALFNAFRLLDRSGVGGELRERLHEILDEAMFASAAGELLDVDFSLHLDPPSVEEIVDMERLKTAVYSFETPLEAGAVLAGASDEAVRALADFGRNLGIAYQIVDDILGVFGDEVDTGKSTIGDLREGKRTVIISYAATTPQWVEIQPLLGDPELDEQGAALIRAALEQSGARRYAEALARDFANRAWEHLSSKALPDAVRAEFRGFVGSVLGRVK
jgi:geranylgeranyl diphosphate synthase type II